MIAKERLTRASADRLRSLRSLRVRLMRGPLGRCVRDRTCSGAHTRIDWKPSMKRMFTIVGSLLGLLVLVGLAVVLSMTLNQLREGAQLGFQTFQSLIETPTHPPKPTPMIPSPTILPKPSPPTMTVTSLPYPMPKTPTPSGTSIAVSKP
jgi:hypothetical protein